MLEHEKWKKEVKKDGNMNSKKIMNILVTITAVLLIFILITIFVNTAGVTILKYANAKNYDEIIQANSEESINSENTHIDASLAESGISNETTSRSDVDRANILQIDLKEQKQTDEYVELVTINDVKISFNMDVSKTTGLSRDDFIYFVQNMKCDKTGILERNAGYIWDYCQMYNVNEIFVLGICGIESAWCSASQHQNAHNYASLMKGGKLIKYESDQQGFEAMIKLLGQRYLSPKGSLYHGSTITGVGTSYCNATTWPKKVYTCMQQALR